MAGSVVTTEALVAGCPVVLLHIEKSTTWSLCVAATQPVREYY